MSPVRTFTVGQLHDELTAALRAAFPSEVWVTGEVVGKRTGPGGNVYFDVVEKQTPDGPAKAILKVMCFASTVPAIRGQLAATPDVAIVDGVEVRIRGKVAAYRRSRQVQIVMSAIDGAYTLGLARGRQ